MNATLIRDFLWRRRLLIGIVSIAHFIIYAGPVAKGYDFTLVFLFLIGITVFSPALTKEMVRQILLLPIERACLSKTYWGMAVALPTVLFMFLGIIATLFTSQLPRSAILQIPAVAFAWFSLNFFVDRFRFLIRQSSFKRKIIYGTITLIGILVAFFASNIGQLRPEHFFAISVGAVFSAIGYRETNVMLVSLASEGNSEANASTPRKRRQKEFAENLSGFAHFAATSMFQFLKGTIIFIVCFTLLVTIVATIIEVVQVYVFGSKRVMEPSRIIHFILGMHSIAFCAIPCIFIAQTFSMIRVFRGLPLSARHLSSRLFQILFGVVLVQAVFHSLLMFLAGEGNNTVPKLLILLGFAGIGCLFMPLVFRFGFDNILLLFAFLFVFVVPMWIPLFFRGYKQGVSMVTLGIGLVCVLISWLLTWRVLARSSQAYRRNSSRFS